MSELPLHHREDHYYGNMSRFREHVWFNLRDLPLFVWRDASVQHFDTLSGDYIWPTRTNSCVPFRDVALDDANQLHSWYPALQVRAVTAMTFFLAMRWPRSALTC